MQKLLKLIGLITIILFITACSNETSGSNGGSEKDKDGVAKVALSYVEAIQNENYGKAYSMLSDVYINAGVTEEQFAQPFYNANLQLDNFNIEVSYVRDRSPMETSDTNIEEPFYMVTIDFESKKQTRESMKLFESDVKWLQEKMWFHKENGKWKFFGTEDQEGITWKPNAYHDIEAYLQAIENKDYDTAFQYVNDYVKQAGYTKEHFVEYVESNVQIHSHQIDKISDKTGRVEDNEILATTPFDNVLIAYGYYMIDDVYYDDPIYERFEWLFHLKDGKWEFIGDYVFDLANDEAFKCYLDDDCDESFVGIDQEDDSNSNLADEPISTGDAESFENGFVYFYTPDCIHCQNMTPLLFSVANEFGIKIYQYNLDENEDAWDSYSIDGTPTIVHFQDGIEVDRFVGNQGEEPLRNWFHGQN